MDGGRGAGIGGEGGTRDAESGISLCLVLLSLSDCSFTVFWLSLAFVTDPFFSFPGAAFTEMSWLVKGGGTAIGG